jgi:hypothetical protein
MTFNGKINILINKVDIFKNYYVLYVHNAQTNVFENSTIYVQEA